MRLLNDDEDDRVFSRSRVYGTVLLLVLINLLNYIDRYTISGIPQQVQAYFDIGQREFGLLQTLFFVCYTILSPVAGYLGDRYSRKYIIIVGVSIWSALTFLSSFVPGNMFGLFLAARCVVGIGEACYCTVAPTILADLFVGKARVLVFGIYFFSTPAGLGLGYMLGSIVAATTSTWQWALRITAGLGLILITIMTLLHRDPPRGQADGAFHMHAKDWRTDIRALTRNRSFMLVSAAFTCISFNLGALTWYGVDYLQLALGALYHDTSLIATLKIPITFGALTFVAGIVGVMSGSGLSSVLRRRFENPDAMLCTVSMFIATPVTFFALLTPTFNFYLCYILLFVMEFCLCFTWALVTDMTMSVVLPTRRSSASAVQMIMIHALGDCLSPLLVGAIADSMTDTTSAESKFYSLQRALFLTPFLCLVSAMFFGFASRYLLSDINRVEKEIQVANVEETPVIPVARINELLETNAVDT